MTDRPPRDAGRQLPLCLPVTESHLREDFFVSPANALALRSIDGWRDWPGRRMALTGPPGSGKSHLAAIWAAQTGAKVLPAAELAAADLMALAGEAPLLVEDAHAVAGQPAAEAVLLHLFNMQVAAGGWLLLTGCRAPAHWAVALPDLASRLQAMPLAQIAAPDDALLSAVLVKLFADRQVTVPPGLIGYTASRMERSLAAARDLVARLDARALGEGRAISRAMVSDLLDSTPSGPA